jgi:DnaK suppressor protein
VCERPAGAITWPPVPNPSRVAPDASAQAHASASVNPTAQAPAGPSVIARQHAWHINGTDSAATPDVALQKQTIFMIIGDKGGSNDLGDPEVHRYKPAQRGAVTLRPASTCEGTDGMLISLPPDYRPSDGEEFMNPLQTEYFRQKLLRWRAELVKEASGTLASLGEGGILEADITDRASVETDRALELRTRDRARKLIGKIDQALQRIENNSYGYCEESGEPIGLRRLEARPIATLSIEAQERHERMERVHRDD